MEFHVLGPLEVAREGGEVDLGPAKQRALLAILLVTRTSSFQRSADRGAVAGAARDCRQRTPGLRHKLRKALEPERARGAPGELLVTQAPGYTLRVAPDQLDAHRFERLLGGGRAAAEAGDPATAAGRPSRGTRSVARPGLADFAYDPFAQAEIARLEELRLDATEDRIEADLALGEAADLVGELEALISDNPLRERLRGQLMLALYRAGRQADALEVYDETRRTLDEELGLVPEPGSCSDSQTAILRQEPALEVSIESPAQPERRAAGVDDGAPEVRKTVTVLIARRPNRPWPGP